MFSTAIERLFKISSSATSISREILAGLSTFAAMSYILVVNPSILGMSGMPIEGLITVTALAAALGTLLMGLMTNYPIALAPGMGLNAFFAFTICLTREVPWQGALGIVFWNGVLFVLLSLSGFREKVADTIPDALKIGVQCGIGLFIAFIGLQNAGIIVDHPVTLVGLGDFSQPSVMLAFVGIVVTMVMHNRGVPASMLLSVILITLVGTLITTETGRLTAIPAQIVGMPEPISNTFMAMDLMYPITHLANSWDLILALLFVNMFDTIGTLLGVSKKANLLDANGKLPKIGKAMTADACASVVGAGLGTSPVTSYVESATGVTSGGRTGLTSIVVAVCFLLSLFFTPLMKAVPLLATTPALVMVGVLMMDGFRNLDVDDGIALVTATVAMIAMPLTFSISEGIALGFITYVGLMLGTGKGKSVSGLTYALTLVFVARYVFGQH